MIDGPVNRIKSFATVRGREGRGREGKREGRGEGGRGDTSIGIVPNDASGSNREAYLYRSIKK